MENPPATQRPVRAPLNSTEFTAEEISEINEIRVKEREKYYFGRFWIVGGMSWLCFLGMFGLQFAPEFKGVRADYPWFFFGAFFLIGVLIVWATIAIHPLTLEDEDTYLWKKVNEVASEKHNKYKQMNDDQFSTLMKSVGMRGGREDKK
jgi:hypothetical protein